MKKYIYSHTYVYESPEGSDIPVPPQTGSEYTIYANYLLLLAIVYLLKKYYNEIKTK